MELFFLNFERFWNIKHEIGNREQKIEKKQGTGNGKHGTENREQGTGNQGTRNSE